MEHSELSEQNSSWVSTFCWTYAFLQAAHVQYLQLINVFDVNNIAVSTIVQSARFPRTVLLLLLLWSCNLPMQRGLLIWSGRKMLQIHFSQLQERGFQVKLHLLASRNQSNELLVNYIQNIHRFIYYNFNQIKQVLIIKTYIPFTKNFQIKYLSKAIIYYLF